MCGRDSGLRGTGAGVMSRRAYPEERFDEAEE